MRGKLLSSNESKIEKLSYCYGCGFELRDVSLLVCAECLDIECDQFEQLVEEKPPVE